MTLSYGSRGDITSACRSVAGLVQAGKLDANDVSESHIAAALCTSQYAGEHWFCLRWCFMMLEIAQSPKCVAKKQLPLDCQQRQRIAHSYPPPCVPPFPPLYRPGHSDSHLRGVPALQLSALAGECTASCGPLMCGAARLPLPIVTDIPSRRWRTRSCSSWTSCGRSSPSSTTAAFCTSTPASDSADSACRSAG